MSNSHGLKTLATKLTSSVRHWPLLLRLLRPLHEVELIPPRLEVCLAWRRRRGGQVRNCGVSVFKVRRCALSVHHSLVPALVVVVVGLCERDEFSIACF